MRCCGEFGVQVLWRYSCVNNGQDGRQSIETLSQCGVVVFDGNPKHVMYFCLVGEGLSIDVGVDPNTW